MTVINPLVVLAAFNLGMLVGALASRADGPAPWWVIAVLTAMFIAQAIAAVAY